MKKIILAAIVMSAMFACNWRQSAKNQSEEPDTTSIIVKGDTAPYFELVDGQGAKVTFDFLKGSYSLLVFFATWCPYCCLELPEVQKVYDEYGSRPDFKVLTIGRKQDPNTLTEFFKTNNYTLPVYADTAGEAFHLFAKRSIPRTYLIDNQGVVVATTIGFEIDSVSGETSFSVISNELKKIFQ
ncbi:thioredoxin [Bacteroidia bacterium]|nr:thioredoxin [Bacteroidia bacterium]